ncbi:hypothetical protein J4225_00810 [Candidatus Pacearchaeota archaeon]|nr:hypothetical protein [Candidatus Pacearchaeota archaeon]
MVIEFINRSLLDKLKVDGPTLFARVDDKDEWDFLGGWQKLSVFLNGMPRQEIQNELYRALFYSVQNKEALDEAVVVGRLTQADVLSNYIMVCRNCLNELNGRSEIAK